jgi:wyosine [tRNA(Phe)-imidazoG37] synthetase (radical SAM superfamily)
MRGVTEKLRAHWQKTDYVTFLGCGEPTLASNLAEVCSAISDIWKGKKALLTSGALIWKSEVRRDSLGFDVVLPTVSAGEQGLWRKIHRPHPSLSYAKVMSGLRGFAAEFSGQIWVEVMLLRGVNDDLRNLEGIRKAIEPLNPEKIQLMAPTRPPAEKWVHCPSKEAVERAIAAIPGSVDMTEPEKGEFAARRDEAVEDLLAMAMVHPMREEQAMGVLLGADLSSKDASSILKSLEGSGKLIRKVYKGTEFYRAEE